MSSGPSTCCVQPGEGKAQRSLLDSEGQSFGREEVLLSVAPEDRTRSKGPEIRLIRTGQIRRSELQQLPGTGTGRGLSVVVGTYAFEVFKPLGHQVATCHCCLC